MKQKKSKQIIDDNLVTRFGSRKKIVYRICNNVSHFKNAKFFKGKPLIFEHLMKNENPLSEMHVYMNSVVDGK